MTTRALFTVTSFLVTAALGGAAVAQDQGRPGGEERRKIMEACKADMEKHCKDIGQERGARRKCMMEHEKDFSAECKAAFEKMRERWAARGNGAGPGDKPAEGTKPADATKPADKAPEAKPADKAPGAKAPAAKPTK